MRVIVCVDDDPLITQLLNFQLSKHIDSAQVLIESINEPERFFQLSDELEELGVQLKLMIVDYQMPKMNGAELIRLVKKKYPSMKFIMLSGQANAVVVDDLIQEGLIHTFFNKPWNEEELIRVVNKFLT
jgi:DNA-binding NarL/FixJ family response regulator